MLRLLAAVVAFFLLPADASAAAPSRISEAVDTASVFVVFDLSGPAPTEAEIGKRSANRVFHYRIREIRGDQSTEAVHAELMKRALSGAATSGDTTLLRQVHALHPGSPERWISEEGDSVQVFAIYAGNTPPQFQFLEEPRRSRLSSDLSSLAQLVMLGGTRTAASTTVRSETYVLTRRRSVLTITATAHEAGGASVDSAAVSTIAGPAERMFITADVIDPSQIDYDVDGGVLAAKEPKAFLIGLNVSFGDMLSDARGEWWNDTLSGMYLGGLVQASGKPFDQVGVRLGFRHNPIPFLSKVLSFSTVTPFVGLGWQRYEKAEAEEPSDKRYGRRNLIFGVSLNLQRAVEWVE